MVETSRKISVADPVLIHVSGIPYSLIQENATLLLFSFCESFVWRDMGTAILYVVETQYNGLRRHIRLDLPLLRL